MCPNHVHMKARIITYEKTHKKKWKKSAILGNEILRIRKAVTASEREDFFL